MSTHCYFGRRVVVRVPGRRTQVSRMFFTDSLRLCCHLGLLITYWCEHNRTRPCNSVLRSLAKLALVATCSFSVRFDANSCQNGDRTESCALHSRIEPSSASRLSRRAVRCTSSKGKWTRWVWATMYVHTCPSQWFRLLSLHRQLTTCCASDRSDF